MMGWTYGDVRAPEIDTLVVAKGLLSTVALGAASTFETESSRVGVNNANQMLRSRGRAMAPVWL